MNRRKSVKNYTLVELLVTMSIISMLAGMLLSALTDGHARGRYGRWLGYKSNLRAEPELVAYFDFQAGESGTLENIAQGVNREPYDQRKVDGGISNARWTWGRWRGKGALEFDGVQSVVSIADDNMIQELKREFSLEMWMYPYSVDGEFMLFKSQHELTGSANTNTNGNGNGNGNNSGGGWGQCVKDEIFSIGRLNNKKVSISYVVDRYWSNPNNSQGQGHGYAWGHSLTKEAKLLQSCSFYLDVKPEHWYHLVVTYSFGESTLRVYVNGALVHEETPRDPIRFYFGESFIGGDSLPGSSFHGLIDEFAVYNRQLSARDVLNHYEMGRPR